MYRSIVSVPIYKRYQEQIQEGLIVSFKNPELVVRRQNFKLRPKFKNRFLVIKRKTTACLLLPCTEIYLQNYFQQNKDFGGTSDHSVRADISDVKLLTNSLILNTNKTSRFYNNFFQKHTLPPSFYLSEDSSGPKVINFGRAHIR